VDTLVLLEIAHRHFQDTLDTANLDRMTAHRDAEKRCHRLLRLSWKRSTVRVRRFWLLRLLALGFLGLRPFLCIRLGRRLGLREATAHTTQHSQEHLTTPLLPTHMIIRTVLLNQRPNQRREYDAFHVFNFNQSHSGFLWFSFFSYNRLSTPRKSLIPRTG